jgi:hypothetical protein
MVEEGLQGEGTHGNPCGRSAGVGDGLVAEILRLVNSTKTGKGVSITILRVPFSCSS